MKSVVMAIAIGSVWLAMAAGSNSRSWTLDGTFAEANGGCPFAPDREIAPSFVQEDGHTALRLKGDTLTANGEAVFDLLPGLAIRARVKFTDRTIIDLRGPIFGKGLPGQAGAYFLRVDPQPEKLRFSFFVNDGDVEPRVSSRVPIRPGEWYDLAAGWDGTHIWLTVNGETARKARPVRRVHLSAPFSIGSFNGLLRDVGVVGGRQPVVPTNDVHVEPGLQIGCRVVFDAEPKGETTLIQRPGEYLLRYDVLKGIGRFNFYVMLDGKWEPHAACRMPIELGRPYNVLAEWDGMRSHLQVDGRTDNSIARCGKPHPGNRPLGFPPFKGRLEEVSMRVVKSQSVRLTDLHTEEFQPREGEAVRLCGLLRNYGNLAISNCVVTASASGNVVLSPATQTVAFVAGGAETPLAWQIGASTNEVVSITLTVLADGHRLARTVKTVPFMPERVPAHLSRTWQPPIRATRTFHVDAVDGDDTRDGLTPATAWRSFANISGRTLGPGERLLLKRGSVFNEELQVTARGRPDNWAEIGAYGTGPRPTIRRTRFIGDRCAYVRQPSYLAVRDIVFCNAGKGLDISCGGADCRGILVERCLAHHIEGLYRPNAHGIPEWRDCPGAPGSGNMGGIGIVGGRDVVLRDCEMYQCSSGFRATGRDVVLQRLFCHDNYSHNTSPHPFFTSTVRAWLLDSVFDASGWKASAGTMGIMLGGNDGLVIRNCHFLNQPHSGSGDEGGIDFEFKGENCQIDRCTFRNNAGAAIEVLGLLSPQARNTLISRCRFDRDNYAHKLGPSEIYVWGGSSDPEIVCSNGRIEDNGYVLAPGVMFYTNKATRTWRDWKLSGNRAFDSAEALDRAFPYNNPPTVDMGAEIWSDNPCVTLSATVSDDGKPGAFTLSWEQLEGPGTVAFKTPNAARTTVTCPGPGDYRLLLKTDDGEHWRTGRTAVHILPPGLTMARAWTFARNLDTEGWTPGELGTAREEFQSAIRLNRTFADPVQLVCGDYYVLAIKNAALAHILSPDDLDVSSEQADTLVIRLQNHTDSTRMRVAFTTAAAPEWTDAQTRCFDVTPKDEADTVYRVPLNWKGKIKQLRIDFAASGRPVTGTCRIDYIGLARFAPGPAHRRRFPRTVYLTEIPLVTTYSNGNSWTGWTGRWIDWPLMVDRSLEYVEGYQYRVTWPDFRRTLEEIAAGGLDGTTFNVAGRNLDQLIVAALERGEKLPALTVPDYPPQKRTDGFRTPAKEDEPWFAPAFYNTNGYFFGGKPLVTSYWTGRASKEEEAERLAYLRRKHGDFWYVPNTALLSPSQWKGKIRRGALREEDFEQAREKLRTTLRKADGARYDGYNAATDIFDGERSFDAEFFRTYVARIIREVYAEPEFKDKLLAFCVGMGHDNTYVGGQRDSSNGTKTLRDSIACALELDPDFITFFEWDEWNENTGVRPTFWNSFAARRVVRAMRAAAEGRPPEPPLAGDDVRIPNLIVSCRKTLALGDCFRVEVLSVPDAAAKGKAEVSLTLRDENGAPLMAFAPETIDLERMDEHRFKWDSACAGDACAVQLDLLVATNGVRYRYAGLPFAEIRATANWDRKWALMPLRDLLHGASCEVSPAGSRDGTTRIRVKAAAPRTLDRLDVTDGGDLVYSVGGDAKTDFREDADHYVFRSMNFCSIYTQQGATMSVEGAKDAEWMLGTTRTRGLSRKLFPQAEFTTDTYVRLRKAEATNATLRLDWPGNGRYAIPLAKVLAAGVYSVADTNGLCFAVHRFNRQAAFFAPVDARVAEGVADVVPDLPVSVFGGHAITADGKIFRSAPLVLGRTGRKTSIRVWSEMRQKAVDVEVDAARVPDLAYDVSGEKTGTVATSGYGWAFNGILGGSTAAATRRNRGGDSRQHCCTEERRNLPSRAPAVKGRGRAAEMWFDGTGTYFVMPGGTIPTTCAYRFSFEFKPDDPERDQEIFACGTPLMWGAIGFLRLEKGGRLHGVGLGLHEYGDAHFYSSEPARKGEWNTVEIEVDVDTIELFLNGKGSGRKRLVQPGRCNCNCWFGGRPGMLYRGAVRDVRIRHGNVML